MGHSSDQRGSGCERYHDEPGGGSRACSFHRRHHEGTGAQPASVPDH